MKKSFLLVGLMATFLSGCGSDRRAVAPAPIAVSISIAPSTKELNGGETQQFTATVSNVANTAVTWTVVGGGTISTSGLYTAPARVASQTAVTVTATSQADTTKSVHAAVTLMPVVVQVSPASPTVRLINTEQFSASVTGTINTAVNWSIAGGGCSGTDCGTIDTTGLYRAPWCVPSPAGVTVTATSVADSTKTGTAVVTPAVAAPTMAGRYGFLFQGTDADGLLFTAGSFAIDTSGNITSGIEDVVRMSGVNTSVTFTGSYEMHCYNRGTFTLTDSLSRTQTFAFAINAAGDRGHFIELDSSGVRGSGVLAKQAAEAFGAAQFSGDYAFGLAGSEAPGNSLGRVGMIGRFHADGAGLLTSGAYDLNVDGTNQANVAFSGVYNADATTGRGTAVFDVPLLVSKNGATSNGVITHNTYHLSFYVISATESFWISNDTPGATRHLFGGQMLKQSGGPFTASSLNTTGVFSLTGKTPANQNSDVGVGILAFDGISSITGGPMDENYDTTLNRYPNTSGTYTVDGSGNGRGTMHIDKAAGVSSDLTFYLVRANTAFLLEGTASVSGANVLAGYLEPRSGTPYSVGSFSGSYYFGTMGIATGYVPVMCGVALADGAGNLGGMGDESDIFGQYADISMFVGGYEIPAIGRIEFGPLVFYMVSPSKGVVFEMDSSQHQPSVIMIEN